MNKPLLLFCLLAPVIASHAQVSLTNPRICHDKNKFLRCYYDGYVHITVEKGRTKFIKTTDSIVSYNVPGNFLTIRASDTVQLKLLPSSILITNGRESFTITSTEQMPGSLRQFYIDSLRFKVYEGLIYMNVNGTFITVTVRDFFKTWTWRTDIQKGDVYLRISLHSLRKNRLQFFHILNDDINYRFSLATSRSYKKVYWLRANSYIDTTSEFYHNEYPRPDDYQYWYSASGKLKSTYAKGELRLCECDH